MTRCVDEGTLEDKIQTINDGRTRTGAFESATTLSVSFEPGRFADIKIFPSSVHICGLRDLNECKIMLKYILKYFENIQTTLDKIYDNTTSPEEIEEFFNKYRNNYPSDEEFRAFRTAVDASRKCNTIPINIESQNIVMTNYKGSFNTMVNTRELYNKLQSYPGLICNLSTMSNSNALNIIVLEIPPFYPIVHQTNLSEDQIFNIKIMKKKYLGMSRRNKAQDYIKHSVFVYSSGKFIQSSRKNESSLEIMQNIVTIVMGELGDIIPQSDDGYESENDNVENEEEHAIEE